LLRRSVTAAPAAAAAHVPVAVLMTDAAAATGISAVLGYYCTAAIHDTRSTL
jgi:hypothetical protein